MKLIMVSIAGLLLLLSGLSEAEVQQERQWVSLGNSNSPGDVSVEVLNSTENETIVEIQLGGFWVRNVTENGETFQVLSLPGPATTNEVGLPELPTISELVAIPGKCGVRATVIDYSQVTLKGYRVYPFQEPLVDPEKQPSFDYDEEFYGSDRIYPEEDVTVGKPSIWRDLRVVGLTVNPIKYNPAESDLTVATSITVRLDYSGTDNTNAKQLGKRRVAANYDRMYQQAIINYELVKSSLEAAVIPAESDAGYDYLIIATDEYVDEVAPLADYKNTCGYSTVVVPLSSVGYTCEEIKDYITQEYNTSGIRYVLLVGDVTDIPGYSDYPYVTVSDYYYAVVEGDDDFPDLAVGRFSVESETHVVNMVTKSVRYESNPPTGDWLIKALLVAYPGNEDMKEEVRLADHTPSGTYEILYPDFTHLYGALPAEGGDSATNADLIAALNSGQRIVNYLGHGGEDEWWSWSVDGESFTTADVLTLDNGEMTPVILSMTCNTNSIHYSSDCLGEVFTRSAEGAVAFLGASSTVGWMRLPDIYIFSLIFDEGISAIGDAFNIAAIRTLIATNGQALSDMRKYLWLGDPTLPVISGDVDGDGVAYCCDNCPFVANPDQSEFDCDGLGDVCDNQPYIYNPGQAPDSAFCDALKAQQWIRRIVGCVGPDDRLMDVAVLAEDELVYTGYVMTGADEVDSLIVIRTNACGQPQWRRTYAEGFESPADSCSLQGHSIVAADDGGFVIGGLWELNGESDMLLAAFRADGDVLWGRAVSVHTNGLDEICHAVAPTADTGYVLAGSSSPVGVPANSLGMIIKANGLGVPQWSRTYAGLNDQPMVLHGVQETLRGRGGFILAGRQGADSLSGSYALIKTDNTGSVSWHTPSSDPNFLSAYSVDSTLDGGFVTAGFGLLNAKYVDRVVKFDGRGNLLWQWSYILDPQIDFASCARAVTVAADGGCLVGGYTGDIANGRDVYTAMLTPTGDSLWTNVLDNGGDEVVFGASVTSDGGCVLAGFGTQLVSGETHALVARSSGRDADGDGITDFYDNCVYEPNPSQDDFDNDGVGDVCDDCTDTDGDGHGNPGFAANTCLDDNCPDVFNPGQGDFDGDGVGDACDACKKAAQYEDPDFDCIIDSEDNCPTVPNFDQFDTDLDGIGDSCDYDHCCFVAGDADHNGEVNIDDPVYIIDWLFRGGPPPVCQKEVDCDGDGEANMVDSEYLMAYLFSGGPPPVPCSEIPD